MAFSSDISSLRALFSASCLCLSTNSGFRISIILPQASTMARWWSMLLSISADLFLMAATSEFIDSLDPDMTMFPPPGKFASAMSAPAGIFWNVTVCSPTLTVMSTTIFIGWPNITGCVPSGTGLDTPAMAPTST